MSEFNYTQLPPDGTGKRVASIGTIEIKYDTVIFPFSIGDNVTTDSGLDGNVIKVKGDEIYIRLNKFFQVTSLQAGEAIKVEGVIYANYVSTEEDIHSQTVVLAGGENTLNVAHVDDQGALRTTYAGGDPLFDAFGKLGTSESTTIREYQPITNTLPDEFSETTVGTGNISWDATRHVIEMSVGTDNGALARRRSNLYHKYQTGVATTFIFSGFAGDSGKVGLTRRSGYFDDNDGLFFMQEDGGFYCVVRSSVSGSVVETKVGQADWNSDRMDGSGDTLNLSRVLLDDTKIQVMFIDFQWLGGGRVRFGFVIDGIYIVCHEFNHANNIANPYMRTGSLPVTFELENTAATASPSFSYTVSASVKCEGKFTPREHLQGGISEPAENYQNGQGLTVDYTDTGDGILTDGEVSIDTGGTKYVVGDRVYVTGGNGDAILEVTSITGDGVVDGFTMFNGGTGYGTVAGATTTPYVYTYNQLLSIRAAQEIDGHDNRAISIPQFLHITEISGSSDPFIVELVKNDVLGGTVTWLDPYPGNALESTNPTGGGVTSTTGGEVLMTEVGVGKLDIDMTKLFGLQSQLMIRKADITDAPDHFTVRVKPATAAGDVTLLAGMTWKEYR